MEHRLRRYADRTTLSNAQKYDENAVRVGALRLMLRQEQAEVARLNDIVDAQRAEIARLNERIDNLEREDVGRVYEWNANVRADGAYQE